VKKKLKKTLIKKNKTKRRMDTREAIRMMDRKR